MYFSKNPSQAWTSVQNIYEDEAGPMDSNDVIDYFSRLNHSISFSYFSWAESSDLIFGQKDNCTIEKILKLLIFQTCSRFWGHVLTLRNIIPYHDTYRAFADARQPSIFIPGSITFRLYVQGISYFSMLSNILYPFLDNHQDLSFD